MRRWNWPNYRWAIAAALLAMLVIAATLPMRLALGWMDTDSMGFSAREVTGTIWSGRAYDSRVGDLALGDLDLGLSPLSLLAGQPELRFSRQDALRGALSGRIVRGARRGVTKLSGKLSLSQGFAHIPIDEILLEDVEALFDEQGRCQSAQGKAQVMVGGTIAGLDLSQGLAGTMACRSGRAEAQLLSQSGMEKLVLAMDGRGRWQARIAIRTNGDAAMAAALALLGFRAAGDGFAMTASGTI